MPAERRTAEEITKLVEKVKALVDGGESIDNAAKKVGLHRSVYDNRMRKLRGTTGSVLASSLPPRPKKGAKGGARPPKPVDMTSVESLAHNISKIDKKLIGIEALRRSRAMYADRLMYLLKKKT
jgi:hypothetical protein